jgi:hypothetical protein
LGASEPKGLHKRGIENWESIKNDSDGKKKIQKRGNNNPPAVEESGRLNGGHEALLASAGNENICDTYTFVHALLLK